MTDNSEDTTVFGCTRAALNLPGPPTASSRVTDDDGSHSNTSQVVDLIGRVSSLQGKLNSLQPPSAASDTSKSVQLGASLSGIIRTLSTLLEAKDKAAVALRHPVLDNSFPLSHSVQLDIVEIIRILVSRVLNLIIPVLNIVNFLSRNLCTWKKTSTGKPASG